jgi:hypothetical protein
MMLGRVGWFGVALAFGCAPRPASSPAEGGGQSYRQAVELLCSVDSRLAREVREDPLALPQARWDRIREEITNPDAIYLRTILEPKPPAEQRELLIREAGNAGVADCPLARALGADDGP